MPIISETSIIQFMYFSFKFVSSDEYLVRPELKTILKVWNSWLNRKELCIDWSHVFSDGGGGGVILLLYS